jgi:hypothetical protein
LAVYFQTLRLKTRAFVPVQTQPGESFEDVIGVFAFRTFYICVFYPQDEFAALVAGKQPVEYGGSGGTDV